MNIICAFCADVFLIPTVVMTSGRSAEHSVFLRPYLLLHFLQQTPQGGDAITRRGESCGVAVRLRERGLYTI
jgi:hypothetical protein